MNQGGAGNLRCPRWRPLAIGRSLRFASLLLWLLTVCVCATAATAHRPTPLQSGIVFASAEVRAIQGDDFANPGMLWVSSGETLWKAPAGHRAKACAHCHESESMRGVATRYPAIDSASARMVNLEGRINLCRTRHQQVDAFEYESGELLALTTFVAHQSRGLPLGVFPDWQSRTHFERGKALYYRRIGQLNLACTHCHDQNWGKRLLAQTISQGHGTSYPAYRFEWQTIGSLQRRLRACFFGVRAEVPPYGASELVELEYFLAWRASALPVETPGVRR